MANGTQATYEQLTIGMFLEQTSGASEHHAKTSPLPDLALDCKGTDPHSLEEYLTLSGKPKKKIDPSGLSMKMLRECYRATKEETISQYSWKWMDWGTISNGRISTQRISEYPSTGKGSTLSDVLDQPQEVMPKYFLSSAQIQRLKFV